MTDPIIETFREIAASGGEINLLNVFKGIPLSFAASIVDVGKSSIRVVANNHQTVCMYVEKKTFIQSSQLAEIVGAEVVELDSLQRVATLTNFQTVNRGIGNRTQVRVQPKEALEGNIQNQQDSRMVRGELADISQDGLAIYLQRLYFSPRVFFKGARVVITLRLPGDYSANSPREGGMVSDPKVDIHAVVANIRIEEAHSRCRIGLKILPNDPPRPLIAQFIAQRQVEIIREIKTMYDLLVKFSGKK